MPTVRDATFELLRSHGMTTIFGNPGSSARELVPAWAGSISQPAPRRLPFTVPEGAAAVYLPACINRILGNPRDAAGHPTLPEALVAVSARVGLPFGSRTTWLATAAGRRGAPRGIAADTPTWRASRRPRLLAGLTAVAC